NFSGVFWEDLSVPVEDIERIEVVRGPGGSVWGANAVNGVINIVTRSAHDTQGATVDVGAGTFDRTQASARYGGRAETVDYRISPRWLDRGDSQTADRTPADDPWHMLNGSVRADWTRGADAVMVEGEISGGGGRSLWNRLASPNPASFSIGDETTVRNDVAL